MTKLNRLQAKKVLLDTHQRAFETTDRRARTRTLIQMGGLLNMIGLPQLCGIADGDDLQKDSHSQDKAATLLGMLVHLNEKLSESPHLFEANAGILEGFKQRGIRMMKEHEIKKARY
jgi:hypothetical protein